MYWEEIISNLTAKIFIEERLKGKAKINKNHTSKYKNKHINYKNKSFGTANAK